MKRFKQFLEDAIPANNIGGGSVEGAGVGPKGEPGVSPKTKKKIVLADLMRRWRPGSLGFDPIKSK